MPGWLWEIFRLNNFHNVQQSEAETRPVGSVFFSVDFRSTPSLPLRFPPCLTNRSFQFQSEQFLRLDRVLHRQFAKDLFAKSVDDQ